jgi:hypothetical protein
VWARFGGCPVGGRVPQRQEVAAQLGGQLHGGPLVGPGLQRRPLEPRLVGLGPGRGKQPQAVGVGPAEPG